MDKSSREAAMWVDLLTSELHARNAVHQVTQRALIYIDGGLPLEKVLNALEISRATWYRRVAAMEEAHVSNKAAYALNTADREERRTAQERREKAPGTDADPASPTSP